MKIVMTFVLLSGFIISQKEYSESQNRKLVEIDVNIFCDYFKSHNDSTDYFGRSNIEKIQIELSKEDSVLVTNEFVDYYYLNINHHKVNLYFSDNKLIDTFNNLKGYLTSPKGELFTYVKRGCYFLLLEDCIQIIHFDSQNMEEFKKMSKKIQDINAIEILEIIGQMRVLK